MLFFFTMIINYAFATNPYYILIFNIRVKIILGGEFIC